MGGMLSGMENRLSRANGDLQANVTGHIDKAMASIGDLSIRISATEKRLDDVVVTVEILVEKKVEESLRKISPMDRGPHADGDFPCLPASAGSLTNGQTLSSSSSISSYATAASGFSAGTTAAERKERDFWICRRALRLRPIEAGPEKEMAVKFMEDYLKLDKNTIQSLGDFRVERVPFGPKSRQKNEMLVSFPTIEARDVVRGAATNLAGCGPDYGVRLEVANHHRGDMKALQSLSYDLKQKYPEARRNVLYDDDGQCLVLDFCLGEGQQWRRLTAEQARRRSKNLTGSGSQGRSVVDDGELDDILGAGRRQTGTE